MQRAVLGQAMQAPRGARDADRISGRSRNQGVGSDREVQGSGVLIRRTSRSIQGGSTSRSRSYLTDAGEHECSNALEEGLASGRVLLLRVLEHSKRHHSVDENGQYPQNHGSRERAKYPCDRCQNGGACPKCTPSPITTSNCCTGHRPPSRAVIARKACDLADQKL